MVFFANTTDKGKHKYTSIFTQTKQKAIIVYIYPSTADDNEENLALIVFWQTTEVHNNKKTVAEEKNDTIYGSAASWV